MKRYDRAYFDRWYRDPDTRILVRSALERKAALAVAAAESVLGRRIRSALDVGCGEGAWRRLLRRLRPRLRYVGVDASEYAARRFARRGDIHHAHFGRLAGLDLGGPFDLVVCSDVLHYVPDSELVPGVEAMGRLTGGLAWIEVFTSEDDSEGDEAEYHSRTPARYVRLLRRAGLIPVGLYCFVPVGILTELAVFERGGPRA